ncbi:hypothetical protein AAFX60_018920 [Aliivibrio fischeri]
MTSWFTAKELVGLPGLPEHSQTYQEWLKKTGGNSEEKKELKVLLMNSQ